MTQPSVGGWMGMLGKPLTTMSSRFPQRQPRSPNYSFTAARMIISLEEATERVIYTIRALSGILAAVAGIAKPEYAE